MSEGLDAQGVQAEGEESTPNAPIKPQYLNPKSMQNNNPKSIMSFMAIMLPTFGVQVLQVPFRPVPFNKKTPQSPHLMNEARLARNPLIRE